MSIMFVCAFPLTSAGVIVSSTMVGAVISSTSDFAVGNFTRISQ